MSGSNSLPALGTLNRALTHITLAAFPNLNIGVGNMGPSLAMLSFEGDFADQPEVAAGVVPSPAIFVMGTVSVGVLRTQALGNAWFTQLLATSVLGTITTYPDSTAFSPITLSDCVVKSFDPGAYDGRDPVIKMILRGAFYPNGNMFTQ